MTIEDDIKNFWNEQAGKHGASDLATAPDHAYRELEIQNIIQHIKGVRILDIGCGNGYSTFEFARKYPFSSFVGIDYSEKMIKEAISKQDGRQGNTMFAVGDARNLSSMKNAYDCIISERCLINLTSWEEQKSTILQMKNCLRDKGRIILVENFIEGLQNLNALRSIFGLPHIQARWHNRYMKMNEFMDLVNEHFTMKWSENIGNLYYIVSRVIHAALAKQQGKEPEYDNPINSVAARLPSLGSYGYSPNMLYVLEPK